MSREVCGICWCPYDEETGECACAPQGDKESAMNRDDIIRMAREAGLWIAMTGQQKMEDQDRLERFAHLVYESVFRDANIAASRTILDAAILEEREACAKLAEETVCDTHLPTGYKIYGTRVAKAIRERSNP